MRRNVAGRFAGAAMDAWNPGADFWEIIFEKANEDARVRQLSDLIPHWIAYGEFKGSTVCTDSVLERGRKHSGD